MRGRERESEIHFLYVYVNESLSAFDCIPILMPLFFRALLSSFLLSLRATILLSLLPPSHSHSRFHYIEHLNKAVLLKAKPEMRAQDDGTLSHKQTQRGGGCANIQRDLIDV